MGEDDCSVASRPRTFYQKIWDEHVVAEREDGTCLVWIDRHLIHEVTTPQAFEALSQAGRTVHRPDLTLAVPDHNVPTTGRDQPITDPESRLQLDTLRRNTQRFHIEQIDMRSPDQGIVHVIGPEQGFTLPGVTLVCGDSHTSTHGALGALAFGIGTSDIEHVFATQTLWLRPSRTMAVMVNGALGFGISAKDLALAITHKLGSGGATGHVIEYRGAVIDVLSIEGRMTVCNMAIEVGARAGMVAPDAKTFAYLKGRARAPTGENWARARAYWETLSSDAGAHYDSTVKIDASTITPQVSWGTSPEDVVAITDAVPDPDSFADGAKREAARRSLAYMGLHPGQPMQGIAVENIFIGSCTNSRIEDLRVAAAVVRGRKIAPNVRQALVVPGSGAVRRQAEQEGLDRVFLDAGFEWRDPGCSMCLGMNPDRVPAGERCASTSNRNFVGRQGNGSRTHLLSPAMAAAAAIMGRLADVRQMKEQADAAL